MLFLWDYYCSSLLLYKRAGLNSHKQMSNCVEKRVHYFTLEVLLYFTFLSAILRATARVFKILIVQNRSELSPE